MTYDQAPTMKIFLGKPASASVELDLETLDLGTPNQHVRQDGTTVEIPNASYMQRLEQAFTPAKRR